MKKMVSVLLVLALSLCMGISAFAANITTSGGSTGTDVKGTYVQGTYSDVIYSVDVAWGSMEFTYTDASRGTWNPVTHVYDDAIAAAWSCDTDANKITVTNHSNTEISARLTYTSGAGFTGITGSFSKSTINLATAEGVLPVNAPTDSSYLTLSGELSNSAGSKAIIGSVTVRLMAS